MGRLMFYSLAFGKAIAIERTDHSMSLNERDEPLADLPTAWGLCLAAR